MVEIHHLSVESEQETIRLLVKIGLDSESGFIEVIQFSSRCTTGSKLLTSELIFLVRPTITLRKLLEGDRTIPGIDGDDSVEVSVGTEQNGRPFMSGEEWRLNREMESDTVSRTVELEDTSKKQLA